MSERRKSFYRSDIERVMRHYGVSYEEAERGLREGYYTLPPRGTGLTQGEQGKKLNYVAGTCGGAMLGAVVAGPVGAVVGGLLGLAFGHVTHEMQKG